VDPLLGRIAFPTATAHEVRATYFYGWPGDIGGGVYVRPGEDRGIAGDPPPAVTRIETPSATIDGALVSSAIAQWNPSQGTRKRVVIEIANSLTHTLGDFDVPQDVHLQIRADRSGPTRPLLVASSAAGSNSIVRVGLGANAQLTLEGLWIQATLDAEAATTP